MKNNISNNIDFPIVRVVVETEITIIIRTSLRMMIKIVMIWLLVSLLVVSLLKIITVVLMREQMAKSKDKTLTVVLHLVIKLTAKVATTKNETYTNYSNNNNFEKISTASQEERLSLILLLSCHCGE